ADSGYTSVRSKYYTAAWKRTTGPANHRKAGNVWLKQPYRHLLTYGPPIPVPSSHNRNTNATLHSRPEKKTACHSRYTVPPKKAEAARSDCSDSQQKGRTNAGHLQKASSLPDRLHRPTISLLRETLFSIRT